MYVMISSISNPSVSFIYAITQAGSVRSACNIFCSPRTSTYTMMYNAWRMRISDAQYSALKRCKPLHKSHINLCINAKHYVTFFTPVRTGSNYSAH